MRILQVVLLLSSCSLGVLSLPSTHEARSPYPQLLEKLLDIPLLNPDSLTQARILEQIIEFFSQEKELQSGLPSLSDELQKLKKGTSSATSLSRAMLKSIRSRGPFKQHLSELSEDLQQKVLDFIDGKSPEVITKRGFDTPLSPAAKHHFKRMEEGDLKSRSWLNAKRQTSPVVYEDEEKTRPMRVYVGTEFENWGLTIKNTPSLTFVPTTVLGVQNLVKLAKENGKRIRAAGYRHTWTDLYSEDGEYFISMLDLKTATTVPDPSSILPDNPLNAINELKTISLVSTSGSKGLVRLGAAVTNEELRRWAIRNNAWTMPSNVVMVEITYGGSNVPICHGGGLRHKTLSDLARKIEYIDANGNLQSVEDRRLLKAAAGSQGLLGIVTHVTLEFDKMTYAVMKPEKPPIGLAIPPPRGFIVPAPIRRIYTSRQLEEARQKFINQAQYDYYSEYFWFPYQNDAFVNCWNNTESQAGVMSYPTPPDLFFQWIQGWLGGVINDDPIFRSLPGYWQAYFLGTLAMLAMPPQLPGVNEEIRTYLIDALHFRRGVQNMRVRDIELQIPIPLENGKPNWTIVQRAWWDAIAVVYSDRRAPMRIALEMRIMGGSDITLAPQKGNWGTASIEVLTTMAAAAEPGVWESFVQKIVDKWMNYKDSNGVSLNTRPHWAKEWDGFHVNGMPWRRHVKEISFKDQIAEFKSLMEEIGEGQGWTLAEAQARFSNSLWDEVIFDG